MIYIICMPSNSYIYTCCPKFLCVSTMIHHGNSFQCFPSIQFRLAHSLIFYTTKIFPRTMIRKLWPKWCFIIQADLKNQDILIIRPFMIGAKVSIVHRFHSRLFTNSLPHNIYMMLDNTNLLCRAAEEAFIEERDEDIPGHEWERVARLCDFNPKNSRATKDVSRMRSIFLQLKQNPLKRE